MDHDDDTTPLWIRAFMFFDHFHGISSGILDLPSWRACTPVDFELTLSLAALSLFLFLSSLPQNFHIFQRRFH